MGRKAWLLAFTASVAFHGALATSIRLPGGGEIQKAGSMQVSVAGNLSDILGSNSQETDTIMVPAETVQAVEPIKVEKISTLEPDKVTRPDKAVPIEPKRARKPPETRSTAVQAPTAQQKRVASASKRVLRVFARKIARALSRSRPRRIARTGTVWIAFTLRVSGGLQTLVVKKSSGNPKLDRAAVYAVRRARFPKPPKGATRKQRSFLIPYHFRRK